MVDVYAHDDSRESFEAKTEGLAAGSEGDGAVMSIRTLLLKEPLAILYCIDGTYVKASPSILKTSSADDGSVASVQMSEMVQNAFKERLASNIHDGVKPKHFGAAEVTSEVGAQVGSLSLPSSLASRICTGFGSHLDGHGDGAVHFPLERIRGHSVGGRRCASLMP